MRVCTESHASCAFVLHARSQMLNGENGVADGQRGDRGHHRLVLELTQFGQYHVHRQSGDQKNRRDDAHDTHQSVLPHGYVRACVLVEARKSDLAAALGRSGDAESKQQNNTR